MMMMMMEAASNNLEEDQSSSQMMIIKGKRTKRPRLSSPIVLTATASSSSSPGGGDDVEDQHHDQQLQMMSTTTPVRVSDDQDDETTTTSADELTEMSTTEEEEDMANCLILLAQSGHQTQIRKAQEQQQLMLLQQQQPIKAVAAADTAPGLYVYECKTCNRCFSSFQALGGHRASHKKPKVSNVINTTSQAQPKKALSFMEDEYDRRFNNNTTSTTLSLQVSNRVLGNSKGSTNKVHECSVCGAEFASGQALGGHMRRHRTLINTTTTAAAAPIMSSGSPQSHQLCNKRPRSVLELDLNLPAPEEERLDITKLPFSSSKKEQVIVFSASPLVGCHY